MRRSPAGDVDLDRLGLGQDGRRWRPRCGCGRRSRWRGTRWTRCTPLSNLRRAKTFSPLDAGDELLDAAEIGLLPLDHLQLPASSFGIASIHLLQVAREERCLLAAGARSNLQDRGPGIGRVPRQEGELQRRRPKFACRLQFGKLDPCELRHLGVVQHHLGLGNLHLQPPPGANLLGNGLQFRVFPGQVCDLARIGARVQTRLEELETREDLVEAVCGDHGQRDAGANERGQGRAPVLGSPKGGADDDANPDPRLPARPARGSGGNGRTATARTRRANASS